MKLKTVLTSILLLNLIIQTNAGMNEQVYAPEIKYVENGYEFYVRINSRNRILIKKDSMEDVYYGNRKIPANITISVNPYNSKELFVYWTESNTLQEGETGSDGTIKKYIAVCNLDAKKEIFYNEYYSNEFGWSMELLNNGAENPEIKRADYDNTIKDCEILFSKKTIILKDKKNLSSVKFEYDKSRKKYKERNNTFRQNIHLKGSTK